MHELLIGPARSLACLAHQNNMGLAHPFGQTWLITLGQSQGTGNQPDPPTKSRQPRSEVTSPADSVNKHPGATDTFPISMNNQCKNFYRSTVYNKSLTLRHSQITETKWHILHCVSPTHTPMFSGTPWRNDTFLTRFTQIVIMSFCP